MSPRIVARKYLDTKRYRTIISALSITDNQLNLMETINQYLNLCRFKGTLIDQKKSIPFFQLTLAINFIAGFFLEANITDFLDAFIQVILQTIILFLLVTALLYYIKSLNLLIQVLTAFLMCENFLYIIGVPLMVWVTISDQLLAYFLLGGVLIWGILIISYILKQLLFFSTGTCLFMSVLYYLLIYIGAFMISVFII
jgi:hypothetical protein